jgi:ubiquinone biosynthesis protein
MNVLDVPLVAIGVVLTILVFAFGVRRLLGLRLVPLRTLAAGLIAFFVAQPIISATGGPAVRRGAATLPGLWFVLLGLVIALLVGMIFLVFRPDTG